MRCPVPLDAPLERWPVCIGCDDNPLLWFEDQAVWQCSDCGEQWPA